MLQKRRSDRISSHDRHVGYYLWQASKKNKGWSNRQWPGVHTMWHIKNCYVIQSWSEGRHENTDLILRIYIYSYIKPSYMAQVVMLMTGVREVPGSNLDRDSWSSWGFSWIFSVSPWKCAQSTSNTATTGSSKFLPVHGQQPSRHVPLLCGLTADRGCK
jgi:hypothetical protein